MAYKKCVFPKLGTKKIPRYKQTKGLTSIERYKKLKEWNGGWR